MTAADQPGPQQITILGGGSAGWITACLIQRHWGGRGTQITLVESPDIGIIGVGEGSTPQLKAFFDLLGIAEKDWMAACDATYKLGIRFTGWSAREGFETYFHPFPGPVDLQTDPAFFRQCALARRGFDVPCHPDQFFLASRLAEEGKGPHAASNFPFDPSYGYHFDAYKLGAYLSDYAQGKGVIRKQAKVAEVKRAENGDIAALICEDGSEIGGDFFVDCSGFASLLVQQNLAEPFLPFADNLFNDRAVVMPSQHDGPYRLQTDSIAMQAGWRWSIPLTSRIGNGYVYSSAHLSDDQAEQELRQQLGLLGKDQEARFLKMKVGRVRNSWVGNCLATGLAQGFIEPLEATALHIVISTGLSFIQAYEAGGFTAQHRDQFNQQIAARYEGIRDYIVAHYRMNQRYEKQERQKSGEYWRANGQNQNLSDGLKAMMTAWFTGEDLGKANAKAYGQAYGQEYYSTASWHCLFAGYGTFPDPTKMQPLPEQARGEDMAKVERIISASAENFARQ